MRESPRIRRLRTDQAALEQLQAESSVFGFTALSTSPGFPIENYLVRFLGMGFWRPPGIDRIFVREQHEVEIRLGASYPRSMPDLRWRTPVFHPNISSSGSVCLGGYGKHWVPSLRLDELCHMLWDMVRFENFDINSPFNREAAGWAQSQKEFEFPIDLRPIRNRVAGPVRESNIPPVVAVPRQHLDEIVFLDGVRSIDIERSRPASAEVLYID